MASSLYQLLPFFCIMLAIFTLSQAKELQLPQHHGLLFPIRKDVKTLQYYTTLEVSTKGNYVNVVLDLGGQHLWLDCTSYNLPTYLPIPCHSEKCALAKGSGCRSCQGPARPGCANNTCGAFDYDPFSDILEVDSFVEDFIFAYSTDGRLVKHKLKSTSRLTFSCSDYLPILAGLASPTKGLLGLSMSSTALQTQFSSIFKLPKKFALCIPSSTKSGTGSMFVGGGSYFFPPQSTKDLSKSLHATPLVTNPVSTAPVFEVGDKSDEYFIKVKSIKIGGKTISFKRSLLSFNKEGYGGTKLSTTANYTILHSTIYKPFVQAFQKAASAKNIKKVAAVAPFKACFSSKTLAKTPLTGPDVPIIDFILGGNQTEWKIYGANSIVEVKKGVSCLAFVDGGKKERTPIVLGGYQLENYLIEFDISAKKLRFSTSLLLRNTTCSQSRH